MTQEQLTAFITYKKVNTSLQEELKTATDVNAVGEIAEGAGFSFFLTTLRMLNPRFLKMNLKAWQEVLVIPKFQGYTAEQFAFPTDIQVHANHARCELAHSKSLHYCQVFCFNASKLLINEA
jgi:hypothetical protein